MKMAIQRRLQLASYASSSKDVQSEQTVIPEYLSMLKEKIEKDVVVSAHKSRFMRKKEDIQQITQEDLEMPNTGQKRKQKGTHEHGPLQKKSKTR